MIRPARHLRSLLLNLLLLPILSTVLRAETPPPGAPKAVLAFPQEGSSWVTRTVMDGGPPRMRRWRVLEDGMFRERPVFRVALGQADMVLFDKETRSWVANLVEAMPRLAAFPHQGEFAWPLWVGKRWTHHYTYWDSQRPSPSGRQSRPQESVWLAEAFERVDVPAGTFEAFRIKGTTSAGAKVATVRTLWYAPAVALVVKYLIERTSDNLYGSGVEVTELMEYALK